MGRSFLFYHLCFRCGAHLFVACDVVAVAASIHVFATYSLISLIHYRASVKYLPPGSIFTVSSRESNTRALSCENRDRARSPSPSCARDVFHAI